VQPPGFNCAFFSEGQMSSPTLSTFVRRRQGDQRSNSLRTHLTSPRGAPAKYSRLVEVPEPDFLAAWLR